jgi:Protein of unknown function (DUF3096)
MSACAGLQSHPIHAAPHRSRNHAGFAAAIFGIFRVQGNPLKRQASSIVDARRGLKYGSRFDSPQRSGDLSMTITAAHIPAIVALIAGVLILLMPRLLNLVVAIYLICIGLIGMGVLHVFHMG